MNPDILYTLGEDEAGPYITFYPQTDAGKAVFGRAPFQTQGDGGYPFPAEWLDKMREEYPKLTLQMRQ